MKALCGVAPHFFMLSLIKKQGGWKSDATVWEYIEEGQQLSDNASVILMAKMAEMLSMDS